MVYTSIEIIQHCNLPIAILPFKLLLPMYKPHLICLNILCILAKQESHNFSTYTRLPLHIHKHRNMPMHACKHTSTCCLSPFLPPSCSLSLSPSVFLSMRSSFLQQLCLIFENCALSEIITYAPIEICLCTHAYKHAYKNLRKYINANIQTLKDTYTYTHTHPYTET